MLRSKVYFGNIPPAGGTTVEVPLGTLTLSGFAPTVLTPRTVSVPLGALTLSGFAPTVLTPRLVAVPLGTLTLSGFAPTVLTPRNVAVPLGTLTLTGFAPSVRLGINVAVPLGTLALSGFAPTVLTPRLVAIPLGTLTLTGFAPDVFYQPSQAHAVNALLLPGGLVDSDEFLLIPGIGLISFETGVAEVESRVTPAGKKLRRRKYVVEIDGQDFEVESEQQAYALLDRAKTLAKKAAEAKASEVIEKVKPRAIRTRKAGRITLKAPDIGGPQELSAEILKAQAEIRQIYLDAAIVAELQLLLMLQQINDDEEALLLLMD